MKWNQNTVVGLLFMIPLILVLAWFGLYQFGVNHIEDQLEQARETLNKNGYAISYDDVTISGTPFKITAEFQNPKLIHESNLTQIHGPVLHVSIVPWDYKHILVQLDEGATISSTGLKSINFTSLDISKAKGKIKLDNKNRPKELHFSVDQVTPKLFDTETPIQILFLEAHFDDIRHILSSSGKVSFKVDGIHRFLDNEDLNEPFEAKFHFNLDGIPVGTKVANMSEWSEEGGTLGLDSLIIEWLSLKVEGSGKLSLDYKLRPKGKLEASFAGYDEVLNLWVKAGYLKKKDAQNVEFVLGLISGKPEVGKSQIDVPVTIKKGWFRIGPAKLFKFPSLGQKTGDNDREEENSEEEADN